MALTPNYGWTIPTVGGNLGSWGSVLNTLSIAVDAVVKAVSDVANAALAKAGGTMTGLLTLKTAAQTRLDLGSITGAQALDFSVAQLYTATIGGVTTFSFTNTPTGTVASGISMRLTNPGAFAITWPAGVRWPGGSAPAFTVAGVDIVTLLTFDGGTNWYGAIAMKDVR